MNTLNSFKECVDLIMDLDQKEIIERAKYLVKHPKDVTLWTGRHVKLTTGSFASSFTSTKFGNASQRFEHYRKFLKEKLTEPQFVGSLLRLRGDIFTCACSPNICHGHLLALVANFDRIDRLEEVANGGLAETNQELDELVRRVKNEINPPPAHTLIPVDPTRPKLFRNHVRDGACVNFDHPNVPFSYVNGPLRESSVKFNRRLGHNDDYEDPATPADCKVMAGIIDYFWDRIVETPGVPIPRTPMMVGTWHVSAYKTKMRTADVDRNGVTRGGWMSGVIGGYSFIWYCPPEVLEPPRNNASQVVQPPVTQSPILSKPVASIPRFPQLPSIRPVDDTPESADVQKIRQKRWDKFGPKPTVVEPVNTSLNTILNSSINNSNVKPAETNNDENNDEYKPTLNQVINTSTKTQSKPIVSDLRDLLAPAKSPSPKKNKKQPKKKVDEFEKFWNKVEERASAENTDTDDESEDEPDVSRRPKFTRMPLNVYEKTPETQKFLLEVKPEDLEQTDEIEPRPVSLTSFEESNEPLYQEDDTEDGYSAEYEVLQAINNTNRTAEEVARTAVLLDNVPASPTITSAYQNTGYLDDNDVGYDSDEMEHMENVSEEFSLQK